MQLKVPFLFPTHTLFTSRDFITKRVQHQTPNQNSPTRTPQPPRNPPKHRSTPSAHGPIHPRAPSNPSDPYPTRVTSARSRCRSAVWPICRAKGSKRPKAWPTWTRSTSPDAVDGSGNRLGRLEEGPVTLGGPAEWDGPAEWISHLTPARLPPPHRSSRRSTSLSCFSMSSSRRFMAAKASSSYRPRGAFSGWRGTGAAYLGGGKGVRAPSGRPRTCVWWMILRPTPTPLSGRCLTCFNGEVMLVTAGFHVGETCGAMMGGGIHTEQVWLRVVVKWAYRIVCGVSHNMSSILFHHVPIKSG